MWPFNKKKAAERDSQDRQYEFGSDGEYSVRHQNMVYLYISDQQMQWLNKFGHNESIKVVNDFGEIGYKTSGGFVYNQYVIEDYAFHDCFLVYMATGMNIYLTSPTEYARVKSDLATAEAMANNWKVV